MRAFVLTIFWLCIIAIISIIIEISHKKKINVINLINIIIYAPLACWGSVLLW